MRFWPQSDSEWFKDTDTEGKREVGQSEELQHTEVEIKKKSVFTSEEKNYYKLMLL